METQSIEPKKERIFRRPVGREFFYLIPTVLSGAVFCLMLSSKKGEGSTPENAVSDRFCIISCAIMIVLMAALLFIHPKKYKAAAIVPVAVSPAASMLLLEKMSHNISDMGAPAVFLNCIFFYLLALGFLFATRRTWAAVLAPAVFALFFGIAEHYVMLFRSVPLYPWDFGSIGIAASVVGNYEFEVTPTLAAAVTALLLIIYIGFYTGVELGWLRRLYVRLSCCAAVLVLFFSYGYYLSLDRVFDDFGLYPYLFSPTTLYSRDGFTVAFMTNLKYLSVEKPSGYSKTAANEAAEPGGYEEPSYEPYSDVKNPNIIAIMDEAFSDLSVVLDFETNEDYMPFIRSLSENTVKGWLHTSVIGGSTANTEFEFLTGLSMAYLPTGSMPYQQYIHRDRPSLATQLEANGYGTMSIHPYGATGWNRNNVYAQFGFDNILFRPDLRGMSLVRGYVSDISVFRYILRTFEDKEPGKPMFVFNVTMQNHGGYTKNYANFNDRAITAEGLENSQQLSQYLSLIKETDSAVKYLLTTLEQYSEPTLVIFFGDHQPSKWVYQDLLNQKGKTINNEIPEEKEQTYIVPFFIWANYDIREEEIPAISANYLSTLLCRVANIEPTRAQRFLASMMTEYPVITANGFFDAEGRQHGLDELDDSELLHKYSLLEYNFLFDGNTTGAFDY